jgi:hypothetical protein
MCTHEQTIKPQTFNKYMSVQKTIYQSPIKNKGVSKHSIEERVFDTNVGKQLS